jgi:hypothetical protein
VSPAEFEPAFPASEPPQTYALERAATGSAKVLYTFIKLCVTVENTIFVKQITMYLEILI